MSQNMCVDAKSIISYARGIFKMQTSNSSARTILRDEEREASSN